MDWTGDCTGCTWEGMDWTGLLVLLSITSCLCVPFHTKYTNLVGGMGSLRDPLQFKVIPDIV